ncbi:MAG TPA: 6-phosphogluconolactonase [Candidatus Acidoferrum sp.]|jgi:glucosamine-6-phosphate deaminase
MIIRVFDDDNSLAAAAASQAAAAIRSAIALRGRARIVAATGASQFAFLEALTATPGIDWKRVELFHLDEYIGLPMNHPASFCKYLRERLIGKTGMTNCHLMKGDANPAEVIRLASEAILPSPIDVAFVGIGENGHLAFNDPPADFETEDPYIIVSLDEACRRQQVTEQWFRNISEVPGRAISMSIHQILKATEIICVVPDVRKASAVQACLEGEISPWAPASILRTHANTTIYLDRSSAGLLTADTLSAFAASSQ